MAEGQRLAVLIRHGAYHQRAGAPSALQPFPLTETGLEQALACAESVLELARRHGARLDPVIHSSPQLRAWQTARGLADRLQDYGVRIAEIREVPELSERSVGTVANLTVAEIESVLAADPRYLPPPPGWKADSAYRLPFPGAESLSEAGLRVAGYLQMAMEASQPDRMTLFVGHGASFRHAACHLGVMPWAQIPALSMYHARPLLLCYNAGGKWQHLDGAWKIRPAREDPQD